MISDRFADIDVGRRSFPAFADLDTDGNYELLIGSETGEVSLYREITNNGEISFKQDSSFTLSLNNYSTPVIADVNNDGKVDIISGSLGGGLLFYYGR